MNITSHHFIGHEQEDVEIISIKHIEVLFERDEDTPYKRVLSKWVVFTTYRHDEFYEEDIVLSRASVIHPYNGEKLCKADLSEEEEEKIKDYISNIEFN